MKPNKSNLIYEAVINYHNEVNIAYNVIKEALKNPTFADVKTTYKNVLEVQLNEGFPVAPSLKRLSVGPGLTGPTTEAMNSIRRLEYLLKITDPTANEVGAREVALLNKAINDAAQTLDFERDEDEERLNARLAKAPTKEDRDMLVDEINSILKSVEIVRQNAKIALSKAYFRLKELLDFFAAKKSEIDAVINNVMVASQDLSKHRINKGSAQATIKGAEARKEKELEAATKLESEAQEFERKIKGGGVISRLFSKLKGNK